MRQRKAAPSALALAVYPLMMHAETLLDEGSASDLPAALMKYQEAKQLAPAFAAPYCGISNCQTQIALRGARPSSQLISAAREAALSAIELDAERIEPYSCLGTAQALAWDWETAEKSFLHGEGLGFQVSAARRYGLFLAALGRFDEAAHHLEAAQSVDPFSNRQKVGRTKFFHVRRRFEEGLRQLSEPLIYGSIPLEARFLCSLMAAHLGKIEQARQLIESIRSGSGADLPMMAGVAEVLALIGDKEEASQIARGLKLLSVDPPISRFRQALLTLAMGDREGAISLLTLAVEEKEAELVWIGVDPRFDPIRQTAAFQELLRHVIPAGQS